MLETPVLFLIFNRPETTAQVFEAIRQARPKQLFIAADGPRKDNMQDIERCRQVREVVLQVDWECEVQTLFREKNLGCKCAVSSAIDWFFDQVEEGIILEDDTLPNSSFFFYCAALLNNYRDNKQIMHISGTNFQQGHKRGNSTFYFSNYFHVWGWATWRRAWKLYDFNLIQLESLNAVHKISNKLTSTEECNYWIKVFNDVKQNKVDTWDYQWLFSIWVNSGICITPNINFVSNLGFGADATHASYLNLKFFNLPSEDIKKITYPEKIQINRQADQFNFQKAIHIKPDFKKQIRNQVARLMPQSVKVIMKNIL